MLDGKYVFSDILEKRVKRGGKIFILIAILGAVNSFIVNYTDGYANLFIGLGFLQISDGLSQYFKYYYNGVLPLSITFNVLFIFLFLLIANRVMKHSFRFFIFGVILYFVDSVIFLAYLEGKSFFFHMFIMLFLLYYGFWLFQLKRKEKEITK
ncbi:MAG: hypothetical protein KAZ87_03390 [Spirochaetes bacterium]|nr:hypothetical protein [Spirochaetota bacterium]